MTSDQGPVPDFETAFMQVLGLVIDEATDERVVAHIDLGPQHHQPFGIVHGGVYCAAVEQVASIGATSHAQTLGMLPVGVNNNTHFVASMSEGRVRVVAEPVTQGRTQQLWTVDIRRESDDRLVATGQLRLAHIEPRA